MPTTRPLDPGSKYGPCLKQDTTATPRCKTGLYCLDQTTNQPICVPVEKEIGGWVLAPFTFEGDIYDLHPEVDQGDFKNGIYILIIFVCASLTTSAIILFLSHTLLS